MDERLLDYLLGAADDSQRRAVEAELRRNPAARARLARLRRRLAPLAADAVPPWPPPGLAARTIAAVAARRRLPEAPPLRPSPGPGWLRRADVLVAAVLLLAVGLLAGPALARHWRHAETRAAQNNLAASWPAPPTRADFLPLDRAPALLTLPAPDRHAPPRPVAAGVYGAPVWPGPADDERPLRADPTPGGDAGRNVLFAGGHVRFCAGGPAAFPFDRDLSAAP
jgi:prepilin-type processing-associated H-X9-DG protein